MALEKIYTPIGWQNKPSTATPLGSHNLSKIDEALAEIDERVVELSEDTEVLDEKVEDLTVSGNFASQRITLLEEKVEEAETDITKNADDITSLNNSFTSFSTAMSQGMEHLYDRVTETENSITKNTEDINALKIVPTASGTTAYMYDASNRNLENIIFYGESKQMQTTGKNLYAEYRAGTSNAINMNHLAVVGQLEPNTVYYIAFKGTVGNKYVANAEIFNGTIDYPLNTLTVKEGVNVIVAKTGSEVPTAPTTSILKNAAYNSDPNFSDVMVMKVNEPTPYEPYTNGPSPNPDYPQPIESKVVNRVDVRGKNFFGFGESAIDKTTELRPLVAQRLIFTKIDDNTIKCNFNGGTYSTGYVELDGIDGTKDYAFSFIVEHNTFGFTPRIEKYASRCNSTRLSLMIYAANGATEVASSEYIILKNIQVEEGTTATEFEPYKPIQTVNLSAPIELNGFGGVRDTIEIYADGSGKHIQRVGKMYTRNVSVVYSSSYTNPNGNVFIVASSRWEKEILWTHRNKGQSVSTLTKDQYYAGQNESGKVIYFISDATTTESALAEIQAENSEIYYILLNPIETALPQADIDAIKALHSYKPNTVVMNDGDAEMDVSYVADPRLYIDRKFETLASAIVNQ